MRGEAWGSGVMVAVAATLWVVYLIPTWRRRRQYAAAEKNAARFHKTLRELAATPTLPEHARIKATVSGAGSRQRDEPRGLRARGWRPVRHMRLASSAVLFLALVALAFAAGSLSNIASWALLVIAIVAGAGAFASLTRLARRVRPREIGESEARPVPDFAVEEEEPREFVATRVSVEAPRATWTPTPIPKPLYHTHSAEESRVIVSTVESSTGGSTTPRAPSTSASVASRRFAAMGDVGDVDREVFDLDDVLRRRRAG